MANKKASKEVTDAQAAKAKADPDVNDPMYMPNIEPQTGDEGSTKTGGTTVKTTHTKDADKPKKAEAKSKGVTLDDQTALVPGNTATFTAREAKGRPSVKIVTARETWNGVPSNTSGGARISKIIETGHDQIEVTFYEDGKEYASGTFPVE